MWLEGARVTTHSSLQKPNFARQNSIAKPFLPKTYDDCSSRRLLSPRRRTAAASVLWRGAGAGVWRPSSRRFSTVHVPHTTIQQLAWLQQATLLGGSRFWQTFCKSGTFVRNCILTYLWCSVIIESFMMGFLRTLLFESQKKNLSRIDFLGQRYNPRHNFVSRISIYFHIIQSLLSFIASATIFRTSKTWMVVFSNNHIIHYKKWYLVPIHFLA